MTIRNAGFTLSVVCLTLLIAYPANAQLIVPGIENALSISLEPAHPAPGDKVHLTVYSSLLDISEGGIVWRVNGKTATLGTGTDSFDVTAGALGVETDVEVFVVAADGTTASAQVAIIPTELDVLIDSDSYIPPFYRGAALPSAGTNLHLQAIPHFKRPGGPPVTDPEIIYTWRKNGEVIGNISGRGKSTAVIPVQHLFGSDRISVEARTSDGLLSNESAFSLSPVQPILVLYQNHPLYGIMYHQALGPATLFSESEATFAAVPYFAQARSSDESALIFDWRVNGRDAPQNTDRSGITINAENSSGIALLQLEVTHATNFYLDARGSWNITLSASTSAQNQFGNFGP